jgi:hypothetical protein
LLLSQASFGGNPLVDEIFLATTCCCLRPLSSRWNSDYHEAFLTNFFLFSRWNSGYHEAFLTNFFLFSRWNSGYPEAFLTNFFLFSRLNSGYHEAFLTNFFLFSRWNSENTRFGGRLFLYIYQKEYLHMTRLVKNLAS